MRRLAALAVACCALLFPLGAHAAPAARPAGGAPVRALLGMVNNDRRAAGVEPLRFEPRLAKVALAHSLYMARHGLSHLGSGGSSPYQRLIRHGIRYTFAGENVGEDSGASLQTMLGALESAMLHSPEHRANLLRASFQTIGIGIAVSGDTIYVTEDFTG